MNPHQPELPAPDYVWSLNDEDFQYDSLDDLLCSNDDIEAGRVVYRGIRQEQDAGTFTPDADNVIEHMGVNAYDVVGEHAEFWPDPTEAAREELETFLKEWARKHCGPCPFYGVGKTEPYTVTQEDLA